MLRPLLLLLGFVFVGLAGVGVVLPGLPTTPFLLLAAACFAKSSTRFYNWLTNSQIFGPIIRNWRETRTIPLRAKVIGIISILVVGTSSVIMLEGMLMKSFVAVMLLFPLVILLRLRTSRKEESVEAV